MTGLQAAQVIRRAGIIASAIVALLGSVVSLLTGGLMAIAGMAAPASAASPARPGVSAIALVVPAVFYSGLGIWGITSAIGLLRTRNWARICFLIFGGILAVFSICATAGSLLAAFVIPAASLPENVPQQFFKTAFVVFAAISLAGFGIAIWWLIYFNRSAVTALFTGGEIALSRPSRLPLTLSIIAWLLIVGGGITATQMLSSRPVLVFGMLLRGWVAGVVLAVFGAVSVSAGIGIVKKRIEAHALAVGLVGLGILNMLSMAVLPGTAARLQDVMRETQGVPPVSGETLYSMTMAAIAFGVVVLGAMLLLLLLARKPFVEACRLHVE